MATEGEQFEHGEGFRGGQVASSVTLGPLEAVYQELFAEVLADGVITAEERAELEKTALSLGLDRVRLANLERAMVAAFESSHRVRVVESWQTPAASLAPIDVQAQGDAGRAVLLARIEQLEERILELEIELREARANVNVEVDVGGLTASDVSSDEEDADALLLKISRNPGRPDPYHRLFVKYGSSGELDRQFWVAQALVALSQATPAEQELFQRHRQATLPTPRAGISQESWLEHVYHPEEEPLTGAIFGVVAPAVLLGRVTTLRRMGKITAPKAELKQDPAKATLTAVRALPWAAAILGLAVPNIYVDKDRDHGFLIVPGVPPYTVLGRAALTGHGPLEYAFLAARHLSGYRQEHFIRHLYGSVTDLEDIFLSALLLGSPGLPIAEDLRRRVNPMVQAIEPLLEPPQLDALRSHFMRFAAEGGRTNLQRWSNAAEKTACRAGLAVCGDLPAALGVLARMSPERNDLGSDLIAYSVSNQHHQVRRQMGLALGGRG